MSARVATSRLALPLLLSLVAGFTTLLPQTASAQPIDSAVATELFNAGRDLMDQGRLADACPKLEESARLEPAVGTFAKLAECDERLGHLVNARAQWQRALNLARAQNDARVELVSRELARLDAAVPKLQLVFAGVQRTDLTIRVDDAEMRAGAMGTPLPLDPGPHRVEVSAPGKHPWATALQLAAGSGVSLLPVPDLRDVAAPASTPSRSPTPAPGTYRPAALGVGAVGLVSLAVGGYFAGVAKSKLDQSNSSGCNGNLCPPAAADVRRDARTAGNTATVFMAAGGILLAGGVTLWLLEPGTAENPATGLRAMAAAGPHSGVMSLEGAW